MAIRRRQYPLERFEERLLLTTLTFVEMEIDSSSVSYEERDYTNQTKQVASLDIDGDGNNDVLLMRSTGEFYWLSNSSGEQTGEVLSPSRFLRDGGMGDAELSIGDVDADGRQDILLNSPTRGSAWLRNLGNSEFADPANIESPNESEGIGAFADFDGDNDLDWVFLGKGGQLWYREYAQSEFRSATRSGGGFTQPFTQETVVQFLTTADVDGDGATDLITGDSSGRVTLSRSQSNGQFGARQVIFDERPAMLTAVDTADVDGDGVLEIVASNVVGDIFIAEQAEDGWSTRVLATAEDVADRIRRLNDQDEDAAAFEFSVIDLDQDGDQDIIQFFDIGTKHPVIWLENLGNGDYSDSQEIFAYFAYWRWLKDVTTGDFDGNGSLDFLMVGERTVLQLGGLDSPTTLFDINDANPITALSPELYGFTDVYAADIDNDGHADIVVRTRAQTVWKRNDGNGRFSEPPRLIHNGYASGLKIVDIDNDGVSDIFANGNWYSNDGMGTFSTELPVFPDSSRDDLNRNGFQLPVDFADLTGDGLLDVVWTKATDDAVELRWSRNLGDGTFHSESQSFPIDERAYDIDQVAVADFDGDRFPDLLVQTSGTTNTLGWFRNNGNGTFGSLQLLVERGIHQFMGFFLIDTDSDDDLDFLLTENHSVFGTVSREYRNDGKGNFVALDERLQLPLRFWRDFDSAIDLDADGDQDVLAGPNWLENNGGVFTTRSIGTLANLDAKHLLHEATSAADLDADGDLDIVFASRDEFVGYLNNDGQQNFTETFVSVTEVPEIKVTDYVDSVDLDRDGQLDHFFATDETLIWYTGPVSSPFEQAYETQRLARSVGAPKIRRDDGAAKHFEKLIDLDQDGDIDILTIETGPIAVWYVNDGEGGFEPRTPFEVSTPIRKIESITPVVPVNDAAEIDILLKWRSRSDSHLTLHSNLGNSEFAQGIELNHESIETFVTDDVAHKADFDDDGTNELLLTQPTSIWLFDDNEFSLLTHRICEHYSGCPTGRTTPTDVDRDGDLDVWLIDRDGIAWLENKGGGTFLRKRSFSTFVRGDFQDLDSDGDYDVLDRFGVWFENVGSQRFLERTNDGPYIAPSRLVDVDMDGDFDAMQIDERNNRIAWIPNLSISNPGDANFDGTVSEPDFAILAENFGRADASWADGDFDGDGTVSFLDFLVLANNFRSKA